MKIEVVTAWPHRCERRMLDLPAGAHVEDAIDASGFGDSTEIAGIAIFGQRVTPRHALADGDRVELLHGLKIDPKAARRARAEAQRNVARKDRRIAR